MCKEAYDHFNHHLPPVDSPLIIQVQGHHRYTTPEGVLVHDYTEEPVQLRVSRPAHIERKGNDMQYQAQNGLMYEGRFPWTHA